jgi:hypothetical protein
MDRDEFKQVVIAKLTYAGVTNQERLYTKYHRYITQARVNHVAPIKIVKQILKLERNNG